MQKYPSTDDALQLHTSHYQFMRIIEIVSSGSTCKSARYPQFVTNMSFQLNANISAADQLAFVVLNFCVCAVR